MNIRLRQVTHVDTLPVEKRVFIKEAARSYVKKFPLVSFNELQVEITDAGFTEPVVDYEIITNGERKELAVTFESGDSLIIPAS